MGQTMLPRFAVAVSTLIAMITASGCATGSKSMAVGGGIGAGAGALVGAIADPGKNGEYRTRNVLIGTALGGVTGLISGAVIHGAVDDQKKEAFQAGQLAGSAGQGPAARSGTTPNLKEPQVEARWVEPKIMGNRYVDGHFEYVIVSPARWDER